MIILIFIILLILFFYKTTENLTLPEKNEKKINNLINYKNLDMKFTSITSKNTKEIQKLNNKINEFVKYINQ